MDDLDLDLLDEAVPKKKFPWWIVIVGGCLLLAILLLAMVFGWFEKELPVTEQDRQAVLTAKILSEWVDDLSVDASKETLRKTRDFDGSHLLSYEYDADDLYVLCEIYVETSTAEARASYAGSGVGLDIGASFSDADFREKELMTWGDQSRCGLIYVEGSPGGNYFTCRKGKRVLMLMFSGVYFEESTPLRSLLEPILRNFNTYEP